MKIYTFLPCCLLPLCCFSLNCFSYNVYICYLVLIQFNIFSNNCIIYTFISLLFYLTSLRLYNKRGFFGCKFYHHILYICWKSTQNKVKQPNRVRKTNNCINSIWFSCVFKMKKERKNENCFISTSSKMTTNDTIFISRKCPRQQILSKPENGKKCPFEKKAPMIYCWKFSVKKKTKCSRFSCLLVLRLVSEWVRRSSCMLEFLVEE